MDYEKLIDEMRALKGEIESYNPLDYYTNGKPDVMKVVAADKTHLIKSVEAGRGGKVTAITLVNDNVGHVYVLGSTAGLHKIGRTTEIDKRVAAIDTSSPVPVYLVHSRFVRDSVDLESLLHRKYNHCRERGEWFRLTEAEVDEAIKTINEYR